MTNSVTSLETFASSLSSQISGLLPYIWTIAGAAMGIVVAYYGIKVIIKWFRGIK